MTTTTDNTSAARAAGQSWYDALERLKNQVAWIEYLPESELSGPEAKAVCKAADNLIAVLTKLNHKYND